jgi:hypothetical protein
VLTVALKVACRLAGPSAVLGATPMFFIPGCREVCLWLGAIDASRKTAERQLENGLSLFIYPVRHPDHVYCIQQTMLQCPSSANQGFLVPRAVLVFTRKFADCLLGLGNFGVLHRVAARKFSTQMRPRRTHGWS